MTSPTSHQPNGTKSPEYKRNASPNAQSQCNARYTKLVTQLLRIQTWQPPFGAALNRSKPCRVPVGQPAGDEQSRCTRLATDTAWRRLLQKVQLDVQCENNNRPVAISWSTTATTQDRLSERSSRQLRLGKEKQSVRQGITQAATLSFLRNLPPDIMTCFTSSTPAVGQCAATNTITPGQQFQDQTWDAPPV